MTHSNQILALAKGGLCDFPWLHPDMADSPAQSYPQGLAFLIVLSLAFFQNTFIAIVLVRMPNRED